MVDFFVATYATMADVSNMTHRAVLSNVKGRIVMSHHQTVFRHVVCYGADTHVGQACLLGHSTGRVGLFVVIEHGHTGGGINLFLSYAEMVGCHKRAVVAPLSNGYLALGDEGEQQEQYGTNLSHERLFL